MIEFGSVEFWFSWRYFGLSVDAGDLTHIVVTLPFTIVRWFR